MSLPAQGPPGLRPDPKDWHCFSVIPANDANEPCLDSQSFLSPTEDRTREIKYHRQMRILLSYHASAEAEVEPETQAGISETNPTEQRDRGAHAGPD